MQRSVLTQFKKASSDSQIIFSTHSSNFIDIFDYKNIIIVRKDKNSSYINQIQQDIFNKNQKEDFNKLSRFNNGVNDLFFAKKVILVEGLSDSIVLQLFSEYNKVDLDMLNVSITNCEGKCLIRNFQRILNEFHINYAAVFDDDMDGKHDKAEENNNEIIKLCKDNKYWYFSPNLETEMEITRKSNKDKPFTAYTFFKDGKKFNKLKDEPKNKLNEIMDWIKNT